MQLYALFILALTLSSVKSELSPKYRLEQRLLKNYPADGISTVPAPNFVVDVSISVFSVFGLNEHEIYDMNGWAQVEWKDPKLTWRPAEWSSITKVILPGSKLWTPDIGVTNSEQTDSKDFSSNSKGNVRVEVKYTGNLSFWAYFHSHTPCPIKTETFPFDRQKCSVLFGTVVSRLSDFRINLKGVRLPPVANESVSNWKLIGYGAKDVNITQGVDAESTFQGKELIFVLKRKPMYHIVLAIVPYCIICGVGAVLFVVREPNDRFSISLAILLSMSVYLMIVSQDAPKSMESLPLLNKYLLVQMILLVAMTMIAVIGPILFKNEPENKDNINDIEAVMAPEAESPQAHLPHRLTGCRCFVWRRAYDFILLAVYIVASFFNGLACLYIIPKLSKDGIEFA